MRFSSWKKPLLSLVFASTFASSAELPRTMAALGDSITAGAIASINREDGTSNLLLMKFFWTLIKFGYSQSIGAFEDRQVSWATGTSKKITSHYRHLNELRLDAGLDGLQAFNAAVSGQNSNDLSGQVDRVLSWSQSQNTDAPDYTVIEIGANDVCQNQLSEMTSTEGFAQNIRSALNRLLEKSPTSRILVTSVVDIEQLREVAESSPVTGLPLIKSCRDMWNTHGFCKTVLQEQDPAKRAEVTARIGEYHEEIERIAAELSANFGSDRVRFARSVHDFEFNDSQIAIDCFHPNINGQQALSDLTWNDSWWK